MTRWQTAASVILAILLAPLHVVASDRSPIQAPAPPQPIQAPEIPAAPVKTIMILRPAMFGPYRIRGRIIPVIEVAPGIYREIRPTVPRMLDPLGVFSR